MVADMVEANEFPELSERFGVMSVPHTVVNDGKVMFVGALPERQFLQKVLEALSGGDDK
ncbi:hypothetical protein caldi_32040 [Caldinitratiruptor microaerophilus]|uniref:Thioredoxin-like fold domain-containing protein n=1 Tax=Caldinitratiruptor microaerophilus TaxID=671077 RepID=A0AA35CMM7_9FIRM|nr:hypothetical protein caldi_32040 [Caldinitratiruptor microaerophilus]